MSDLVSVTIDTNKWQRFDLKSAPGGFVMLRPLPYSMVIERRDKGLKMRMIQQRQLRNQPQQQQEQVIDLESMGEWTTKFDFGYCIGDHNLADTNGTKLDFSTKQLMMTLKSLDPRVGGEIGRLIDTLNEGEDDEVLDDFLRQPGSSSVSEPTPSAMGIGGL